VGTASGTSRVHGHHHSGVAGAAAVITLIMDGRSRHRGWPGRRGGRSGRGHGRRRCGDDDGSGRCGDARRRHHWTARRRRRVRNRLERGGHREGMIPTTIAPRGCAHLCGVRLNRLGERDEGVVGDVRFGGAFHWGLGYRGGEGGRWRHGAIRKDDSRGRSDGDHSRRRP
jgi:hypothetical protein